MNRAMIGASVLLGLSAASCQLVVEVREYVIAGELGGTGAGGAGGSGGAGGAEPVCTPLDERPCYSGPEGTEKNGLCGVGAEACDVDGSGWGTCKGEKLPGVELCGDPEDENCDGYDCGIWTVIVGDAGVQRAQDIEVDKDGNVIVVGSFEGVVDFGGGPLESAGGEDFFVLKLDPNGKHLWSKRYGNEEAQSQVRVAVDQGGNVFLAGTFGGQMEVEGTDFTQPSNGDSDDMFAIKLTPEGGLAWKNKWGGKDTQSQVDIAVDSKGDVILSGEFQFSVHLLKYHTSVWTEDIFLMKASGSNGEALWDFAFSDGPLDVERTPVAVDGFDNIYLTGAFVPELTVPGFFCDTGLSGYLVKLSPDGAITWGNCIDSDDQSSIAADNDGNVYVGTASGVVRKFDATGAPLWTKEYDAELPIQSLQLALTSNGDVMVAVSAEGTLNVGGGALAGGGAEDLFLAKYTGAGKHLWSKVYGDAGSQRDPFIAMGPDGTVSGVCNMNGKIDVGTGAVLSKGDDFAVFKLGL